MSLILCLETATTVCSVALASDGKLLAIKEDNAKYSHAETITLYIEEVMKQAGKSLQELDAIAVSMGPGSYTGLRIGVSTAKGLCYALDKPLIATPTLKSMALSQLPTPDSRLPTLLCPMIDARRMEVFCAIYNEALNEVRKTTAEIITENSFSDLLKDHRLIFFGDGAAKCKALLAGHPNVVFVADVFPSSKSLVPLAQERYEKQQFEDVALFEPYYLKDFFDTAKR